MNEKQNRGSRERSWLIVLAGTVAAATPTVLALLRRCVHLPVGLNEFLVIWLWGLGAFASAILAVAALLTCPWRKTSNWALGLGWSAIAAAISVVPTAAYSISYWAQFPPERVFYIVTAGGMKRDMTVTLALSCAAILVGGASVLVARRCQRERAGGRGGGVEIGGRGIG